MKKIKKEYICDITFKVFKQTYKEAFSGDHWHTALDAWFECAGRMYQRGLTIPEEWEYVVGAGGGCEEDSYFYALMDEASDKVLLQIGNFLTRYCQYLKFKNLDY